MRTLEEMLQSKGQSLADKKAAATEAPARVEAKAETSTESAQPASGETKAPPAAEKSELEAKPVERSAEQHRDESGKFASKEAKPSEPRVPVEAIQDERQKRQSAEREAAELRERVARLEGMVQAGVRPPTQAQPQQPKPKTREEIEAEYWQDPVGFVERQKQEVRESAFREVAVTRMALSEPVVRQQHADYDEALQVFAQVASSDPEGRYWRELERQPNPALWAYNVGRQARDLNRVSDPNWHQASLEQERARIREEERARLRAESAVAAAEQTTPSLATARGVGVSSAKVWQGPRPAKAIYTPRGR